MSYVPTYVHPHDSSAAWYARAMRWYALGYFDMAKVARWVAWRRWVMERGIDGYAYALPQLF